MRRQRLRNRTRGTMASGPSPGRLLVLVLLVTPWITADGRAAVKAGQWEAVELTFTAERDYANPYTDVDLHAEFRGPGRDARDRGNYPYPGWAVDHFYGEKGSPIGSRDYPLTWEQRAGQAVYAGLDVVDPVFAKKKIAAPHTWHAAEVFLYLLNRTPAS
jgi:hypothetical protein